MTDLMRSKYTLSKKDLIKSITDTVINDSEIKKSFAQFVFDQYRADKISLKTYGILSYFVRNGSWDSPQFQVKRALKDVFEHLWARAYFLWYVDQPCDRPREITSPLPVVNARNFLPTGDVK